MEVIAKSEGKNEIHPWGQRQVQIFLLFLCMAIAYALRVNLSVGIVAMTNNSSANKNFVEFSWDETSKSTVLSSFFWGYLITQIYAGQMAQKYGGKYFLVGAIGVSGVLTIMIPWSAIHGGVPLMCVNRMVQGMAQGFIFPTVNVLLSKWAPTPEKSRLISFVFSGPQFGSLAMLPTAGLLADSIGGWPAIFYVGGVVALVWIIFWCLLGANSPEEHPSISETERQFIMASLSSTTSRKPLKTPWSKIIKSIPMWTLLIVHMTQNWGFWILLTNMPTYLNYILKFNIKSNGFLSALPYLIMWILIIVFSWISDYINLHGLMSNTHQKKMWNSIAHWGGALALMALCLNTSTTMAIILLTTAIGLNSGVITGFMSNHMDLAPNFAGTLMGITNSFSNVTSILGPLLVGFIVKDTKNKEEWNVVFAISAGIFFLGNLIYIIFGSAEVQSWNDASIINKTQILSKRDNSEKP